MAADPQITIYTDGSCLDNPGPGGWGFVILGQRDDEPRRLSGHEPDTTNNRMELTAAIKGLEAAPTGAPVVLYSDSTYLVNTMTKNWKRRVNQDLWEQLDALAAKRTVAWRWVQGHAGNRWNEEADRLAVGAMKLAAGRDSGRQANSSLTHLDEEGKARMVDVGSKEVTHREAVARALVTMQPQTLELIKSGQVAKGDVFAVARLAGIMGAKQTPHLIPLCHPIPLDQVQVELELDEARSQVQITATATTDARTGVEMEALTAVTVAALTLYDMCKAVDRGIRIEQVRLVSKRGGKSGDIVLE